MLENTTIHLKVTNPETGCAEESGETISIYQLTKAMTPANFATLLEDYLNRGGKGFREGKEIGLQLRSTHRTLQRLVICFALGLIVGLAEQEYTDPRNETAIQTAKRIATMLSQGDLPVGPYI